MNILQNTAILKQILHQVFAIFALYTNFVHVAEYLTNLVFSVCTVSYGSSFFPINLWPARLVLGPQINRKKIGL